MLALGPAIIREWAFFCPDPSGFTLILASTFR